MNVEPILIEKNGSKYIDNINLESIKEKEHGPIIIFNKKRLITLSEFIDKSFKKYYKNTEIHYAIKACYTPEVLKTFLENELRLEVMSEFEYKLAKKVGAKTQELIVNGPGKTDGLLEMVIKENVESINVDSEEELEKIIEISKKYSKKVKIGLRIQPDVPKDSFLKRGEKLGVDEKTGQAEKIIKKAINEPNIELIGIQFHSFINQSSDTNIVNALKYVIKFVLNMKESYGFKPEYIDIGGGLATLDNWEKNGIDIFAKNVSLEMKKMNWNPKLILEPGRFLVSDCAIVIAKIIRKKMNGDKRWIIVNGNTNMLIPLASADFKVESLKCYNDNLVEYNVGDCLCSASGTIQRDVMLSDEVGTGDYIIIKNAGSYTINLSEPFAEPIMPIFITNSGKLEKIHNGVDIDKMLAYFLKG